MPNYKKCINENKYLVTKRNGDLTDIKADYFVVRLDTDPNARNALRAYADAVRSFNKESAEGIDYKLSFY